MGATIKDVAKEAGVSLMTVSRVINNKEHIASATREKVQAAIKKLNYMPNLSARNLVLQKADFLGLVVPDISNPFFGDLVKASEKIAKDRGYSVILGDSDGDVTAETEYIEAFRGRMCEAIILVAPRVEDSVLQELNSKIPLILVDRKIDDEEIIQVYLDNAAGAYSAVKHLLDLGHRRIGFVMGPENVPNSHRRKAGYIDALKEYGLEFDPELEFQGEFKVETGKEAFEKFVTMKDPPTAVFNSNDLMAFGFVIAARDAGYSIPEDFSVVGFDDIFLSSLMEPALTTVRYPFVEMGTQAINMLLDSFDTNRKVTMNENLKHELIIRKSTRRI